MSLPPSLLSRPYLVSIIGAGPSGFYCAQRLLALPGSEKLKVHLWEKLPVPFGLSRYGVAPDHPEVKNCENSFSRLALDPRLSFHGASPLSSSSLAAIRSASDATVLAYGASASNTLGVPGENGRSVLSARSLVAWYNGLPGSADLGVDLSKVQEVSIIGQGNVALDCARLLLRQVDDLKGTDMPEYALAELARSRVKRVRVVGRRGPLEMKGTNKELRELLTLPGVDFNVDRGTLEDAMQALNAPGGKKVENARAKKRTLDLLLAGGGSSASEKEWSLEFLRSPLSFEHNDAGDLEAVNYGLNSIVDWRATPTGSTERVAADLALTSIGYRSVPLSEGEGEEGGVPFDAKRGLVPNTDGRVEGANDLYAAGWVGTGPTGVIASTMFNSFAVADLIGLDLSQREPRGGHAALEKQRMEGEVTWQGWERIDEEERRRGREKGKERVKMLTVEEMVRWANLA